MIIIKDRVKYIFPTVIFLLVIVLSALGIHGSSIGMYNQYFYGPEYKDPNLLFGQVRPIRSDEWLVSSPWALAQVENNLPETNTLYLATQDLTLSDAPGRNWAAFFEPQNWGFFILPVEQAFAFRWWVKAFMLTTAAYILFMMLSEKNILVSIMAALSLAYAPFIQWWYSTSVTEITSFGIFSFVFFLKLVDDKKLLVKIIDSFLLIYFAVCFALTLYPPFQIPLAILFIFSGIGYLLSKTFSMSTKDIRGLIINIGLVALGIGCIIAAYYMTHRDAFEALTGTIYPGVRQSGGGGMGTLKALAGFYNVQLLNSARVIPSVLASNQSEAASFFFASFFLLPFFIYNLSLSILYKKPLDLPLLFTICILIVLLIWGIIGFPSKMAKLFLLNYVDPYRMLFMFGVANHLLIVYYLFKTKVEQTLEYKTVAILFSLGVLFTIYFIGNYLRITGPNFIGSTPKIFLLSAAIGIMMFLLLRQKSIMFFGLFLAFTLVSTCSVNPLYRGLSPLRSSEISSVIRRIHNENPDASWISYGNILFGNYLAANGAQVLNGTYYYPNLDFWHAFDPERKYENVYNRYAHVLISSTDNNLEFELPQGDVVKMKISPCNTELQKLNVKYFLFTSEQDTTSCLTQIERVEYPNMTLYIYERTNKSDESP